MHAPAAVPALAAPPLAAIAHARHAFFTRAGGVSEGLYESLNGGQGSSDDPARVGENRARMAASLGVDGPIVTCYQVHSPDVVHATAPWERGQVPKADALVTDRPGLALAITTADCGPVLFADARARVVGAAHAGWRGALGGVLEATLDAMERLGAARGRIVCAIGPLIRQESYEVGADLVEAFTAQNPAHAGFFAPRREGRSQFDLPGFIAHRLREAGAGTVHDMGLDTYADAARFFSYRRATHRKEPDYGRLISAIALSPEA